MASSRPALAEVKTPKNLAGADFKVLGVTVKPFKGNYVVLKDVNVRAKPLTRSKRVGRLKAGRRVKAVGRVKGPWLAVRATDNILGFVFKPILMPVIDGALSKAIKGEIIIGSGWICNYTIEYLGKTEAKDLPFEFADFEVSWQCKDNGKPLNFFTPMFLSEGPYQGTRRPVHQITVDILELESGLEEVFSTHLLWDREKGNVRFDSVNNKKLVLVQKSKALSADNMAAALNRALQLAASSWRQEVWSALTRKSKIR